MNIARPNRSLQEKSSARLAAVQMLYQASINGAKLNPEKMMAQYSDYVDDSLSSPKEASLPSVPANPGYLKKLLEGVTEHAQTLEPWVDKAFTGTWTKERSSPLLVAILRLAAFELAHFENLKTPVIISEYVSLTARFFGEAETGFINAALTDIANQLREK